MSQSHRLPAGSLCILAQGAAHGPCAACALIGSAERCELEVYAISAKYAAGMQQVRSTAYQQADRLEYALYTLRAGSPPRIAQYLEVLFSVAVKKTVACLYVLALWSVECHLRQVTESRLCLRITLPPLHLCVSA